MAIVKSHEVAEQLVKPLDGFPYSLPKMPSVYVHMVHVTGTTSILSAQVSPADVQLRPGRFILWMKDN